MRSPVRTFSPRRAVTGQATVEFALAAILILTGIFAGIDVSRVMFAKHGLTRAAQVIARDLALASSTDPQTPICQLDIAAAIQDGKTQSDIAYDTTMPAVPTPCPPAAGSCYSQLRNASGSVTITGSPDLCAPLTVQVTISAPFTFATSLIIGARNVLLSQTATVQTAQGMQ